MHKIIEKNENPKTLLIFNTVLFTKNGTRIGNGIIVNIYYSKSLKKIFYTVKTDYGNSVSMSEDQIRDKAWDVAYDFVSKYNTDDVYDVDWESEEE